MKKTASILLSLIVIMTFTFSFTTGVFALNIDDQSYNPRVTSSNEGDRFPQLHDLEQYIEAHNDRSDGSSVTVTIDLNGYIWKLNDEVHLDEGNYTINIKNGTIDCQEKTRAFYLDDPYITINLDNVTVKSGFNSSDAGVFYINDDNCQINGTNGSKIIDSKSKDTGGAIKVSNSGYSSKITGLTFERNTSSDDGGAILNNGKGTEINNCVFNNNYSGDAGGAIYAWNDTIISNCEFDGNTANCNDGIDIYRSNDSLSVSITGCTFKTTTTSGSRVNFEYEVGILTGLLGGTILSGGALWIVISVLVLAIIVLTVVMVRRRQGAEK